ncbi:methenyltetrahydrofolate synthase domain-containing protein isoform X2 [Budorcas taxicolor]|uniref:methenyltetrahydrofolate synthase domain-containing protein isoform X2 n=1 Tax=Budorcas taxicolor TaxID=37181 RepID=UPI0022846F78|nr:methenyltetrahydrofolate synthase domain-containing protein isoform X2 [Budorcas taxicolor]
MEPRAGVSKQDIRERIWDYMESQNLADFPRPVHHRIPNFKGASRAAEHFPRLQAFKMARTIKVNPDAPQKNARFFVLESKKTLLVPTPRLRTGLFNKITPPPGATKDILRKCATSQGVRNYSTPVGLDSKVLVDLVVVGSVAVSEKEIVRRCSSPDLSLEVHQPKPRPSFSWRIGKGEGYADLEYAMMVSMGAVSQGTPVVTIVHDCQVVDIPEALLEDHDLTVDYILTPTRVITTGCERPKPAGIAWSKISCEMLGKMPILRSLRHREEQAGKDVTLQDGPRSPPGATRSPQDLAPPELGSVPPSSVQIGNLPRDARVSELKRALSALGVAPSRLTWQGPQHRAFLHYRDPAEAQQAIACLQGFRLGANTVRVVLARQQRASDLVGGHTTEPLPNHRPAIAGP